MKSHKLKHLGVPAFLGQGLAEHASVKLRFMVMERFSEDVDQIFLRLDRRFDTSTVLMLGIRIVSLIRRKYFRDYWGAL